MRDYLTGRRQLVKLGLAALGATMLPTEGARAATTPQTPDAALKALMDGNARFVAEQKKGGSGRGTARRLDLTEGQFPFAAILSCADSRVPVEVLFDQGLGDLFVVRVAGNAVGLADHNVIGSLEYGVAVLKAPLVMVLGHSNCGAVDAALKTIKDNSELPGSIEHLVDNLRPAARKILGKPGDALAAATEANVQVAVARLRASHPILAPAADKGTIRIVGAVYDLHDGLVRMVPDR